MIGQDDCIHLKPFDSDAFAHLRSVHDYFDSSGIEMRQDRPVFQSH